MRRFSLPLLVGVACLLGPLAAAAQDYTPTIRPSTFVPLDANDPGVTVLTPTGNAVRGVVPPFSILYYGDVFNQLNVSSYGYITFSSRPGFDDLANGYADPTKSANQNPLPNATAPNGLIAAWWDTLTCPAGTIKTRDAVVQGSRTFTVEWNGCYRTSAANTVQMQVVFTEMSPIIRVLYGANGGGTHDATVGIENPARWRMDRGTGSWTLVTAGGTAGITPTLAPACPAAGCDVASWPTNQMIQYGRPNAPDLQSGVNAATGTPGLSVQGLSGFGTIAIELQNNVENGGLAQATNFTWDYYLSADDRLDASDTPLGCSHATPETIPGLATRTYVDSCTATLAPGFYRICTLLDPPTGAAPEGAVIEANEENNAYCSGRFVVGADLRGSIVVPASAEAGGTIDIPVLIENRGSDPTAPFKFRLWLRGCNALNGQNDVLAYEGTISLEGGASWSEVIRAPVRPDADGLSTCALLSIDPDNVVPELDEANNGYSSCVQNGETPKQCAVISRPDLRINQLNADLPDGCYFGEDIGLHAEVCNDGPTEARSFGLAFFLDINSVATLNDTMILSMPQACRSSADCVDLGGGAPTCVLGVCQAPCVSDAECGGGGLECEPSFTIPGNSCQMVIPGNSCEWVSTVADIPTFDTRANAEFADGNIFFSVIADWTGAVGELNEGNENKKTTADKFFCWTRKPDFQPVEVRTTPEIASGEVVPVYRRVRNIGTVGSTFRYRYVLTSNDTVSVNDLALSIEGVGPVGEATVGARSDSVGTDRVRLPAGIVPGTYYLGLIADPDDGVLELLENNNTARSTPVTVVDASLRIATGTLREATVGASYTFQLLAAGGEGTYAWSVTDGTLPPGLALAANGLLGGTATTAGTYLFQATVTSGPNTASRLFALDVAPARGPLAITLGELPPAFAGVEYRVVLGAAGGLPPYAWACPGKPNWLGLQNNLLFGTTPTVANPVSFSCEVTDANGTRVTQGYRLAVYPANGIRIRSQEITGGPVGEELTSCVVAEGGSGQYGWSFDAATAPAGLSFGAEGNAGCFAGVPAACGTYLVGITVTDAVNGLSDARRLPLTVYCNNLRLATRSLPAAERGVDYPEVQLRTNSALPVVFELAGGELPLGVSLSPEGTLSGRVAGNARTGAHNVAVRFHDEAGGTGLGAIAIDVLPDRVPTVTVTNTKKSSGCSAAGGDSAAGLLPFAAIFALLGLRRRSSVRSAAVAGLAAVALLAPAVASAQTTPGYATYHRAKTYQPYTAGSVLTPTATNSAFKITLNGWTVPFFGESYESMWFHENGLILFSSFNSYSSPYPIPYVSSSSPRNFIAGWWDDHTVITEGSFFRWGVRGTAPNRELVYEWVWLTSTTSDTDDGGEHQISIFEDGTIAIRWGDLVDSGTYSSSHRAVMGLMDAMGSGRSVPFHPCSVWSGTSTSAICDSTVWNNDLRNTEAVFTTLPNLQVRATETAVEALAGLDQTVSATVYNYGPYPTSATVRFFVSDDRSLSDDDVAIGTSAVTPVGAFAEKKVEVLATLPRALAQGRHFLLAVADPEDAVREFVEDDNAGGSFELQVVEPLPDLAVARFGAPAAGAPGSTITVDLTVHNAGNLAGTDVPFAVVLSGNEVISASDIRLYEGTVSVDWLSTVELAVPVTLPSGTPPGAYHVGVVLDPDGTVRELDKLNNALGAERPFVVSVDGLAVLTVAPGAVQIGAELCIPLRAEGGDGLYSWTLVAGTLPPGVALIPGAEAALCGRPTALGVYDFTLEVVSGNRSARSEMTIEVIRDTLALGISVRELPVARFQETYEAGLTAFGGTVPYTWELASGVLPAGLSFGPDGLVFGTPLEAGTFALRVRVTDAADRTATENVTLLVAPPSRVTCSSRTLGTLELGEAVGGKLLAAGGAGTYEWTTRSTRRVGDPTGLAFDESQPPPGLALGVTGDLSGAPEQVGRYLWTVQVKAAGGLETDVCSLTVDVVGPQGLTVTTAALPDAVTGQEYRVELQAVNGEGNLAWTLAEGSALPQGLVLDTNGALFGMVAADVLQGEERRTFGFLVEVRDRRNLKGTAAFSVTVGPEAVGTIEVIERTEGKGCQAAGGGFSLAALALVLGAVRRRR